MMVSEKPLITKFKFKNIFIFYFSLLVRYLSSALNNRTSELKHGRVPFVGSCRSFIFVYIPGVSLPDARALAFPILRGPGICPGMAAWTAPASDTHMVQYRWPWLFPPSYIQWHWILHPWRCHRTASFFCPPRRVVNANIKVSHLAGVRS